MMKRTLLALGIVGLLTACDNDLKINADWKDVPVVYGLLNVEDTVHYIKLNKAFLGEQDMMVMAQDFYSLHYHPDTIGLRLVEYQKIGNQFEVRSIIQMEPTEEIVKPPGDFHSDRQIIYKTSEEINMNRFYDAEVYRKSVNAVIAHCTIPVQMVKPINFSKPSQGIPLNMVPGSYPAKAEWNTVSGGKLYEMKMLMRYVEQIKADLSDTVHKSIEWVFPIKQALNLLGGDEMVIIIDADQFLAFIAANIEENPNVYRQVQGMQAAQVPTGFAISHSCLDFTLNVAGDELSTYLLLNESSSSIVTDRPEYSNIENGIGIFSSRSQDYISGVRINNSTNYEIATHELTNHLNFAYFELGGDNEIDTLYWN